MTKDQLQTRINVYNPHYEIVEGSLDLNKPLTVKCKCCGTKTTYQTCTGLAYRTVKCPECERRKKEQQMIDKLLKLRPWIQYVSGYKGNKSKCIFKCLKCENTFEALPNNLFKKVTKRQGCRKCLQTDGKTQEEFEQELAQINPDIEVLSEYSGYFQPVTCKCKLCGYTWGAKPDHLLRNTKCPKCKRVKSKGEQEIIDILYDHRITFISQFPIQMDDYKAFIDIYIPEKNTFIEYNGQQHYFPVSFGEKDPSIVMNKFQKQLERDQKLRDYCKALGIVLLEVKYDVEDIEQYLIQYDII